MKRTEYPAEHDIGIAVLHGDGSFTFSNGPRMKNAKGLKMRFKGGVAEAVEDGIDVQMNDGSRHWFRFEGGKWYGSEETEGSAGEKSGKPGRVAGKTETPWRTYGSHLTRSKAFWVVVACLVAFGYLEAFHRRVQEGSDASSREAVARGKESPGETVNSDGATSELAAGERPGTPTVDEPEVIAKDELIRPVQPQSNAIGSSGNDQAIDLNVLLKREIEGGEGITPRFREVAGRLEKVLAELSGVAFSVALQEEKLKNLDSERQLDEFFESDDSRSTSDAKLEEAWRDWRELPPVTGSLVAVWNEAQNAIDVPANWRWEQAHRWVDIGEDWSRNEEWGFVLYNVRPPVEVNEWLEKGEFNEGLLLHIRGCILYAKEAQALLTSRRDQMNRLFEVIGEKRQETDWSMARMYEAVLEEDLSWIERLFRDDVRVLLRDGDYSGVDGGRR